MPDHYHNHPHRKNAYRPLLLLLLLLFLLPCRGEESFNGADAAGKTRRWLEEEIVKALRAAGSRARRAEISPMNTRSLHALMNETIVSSVARERERRRVAEEEEEEEQRREEERRREEEQ